jgi:phage terminase large subunit-like protein
LVDTVLASRYLWREELARQEQLAPTDDDWVVWLYLAGRGAGKTRTAAEWLVSEAIQKPKTRWAIVAPTFGDVRDTCIEGESGVLAVLRRYQMLEDYNRSIGEIVLKNGSRLKGFSADKPDRFRGPQHHGAWCDELAAYRYTDAWDQLQFGLRLGERPRVIVTTTPRPVSLIRNLVNRNDGSVVITRGSTFDNAKNLAPSALADLKLRYEGTRLGRQELYGEVIDEVEGALWTLSQIDATRVKDTPPLMRIVVAIDPAVTSGEDSDETGIVVAGITSDGQYYILEDLTMRSSPDKWARTAVDAYRRWSADRIVGETNNGGDMIEALLRQVDPTVSYKKVTATRGKMLRAEPVASIYEQSRAHHVGSFQALEDQMCNYTPESDFSPDRLDALVWAMTELMEGASSMIGLASLAKFCPNCRMPSIKTATVCSHCHSPLGD